MKRVIQWCVLGLIVVLFVGTLIFLYNKSHQAPVVYQLDSPTRMRLLEDLKSVLSETKMTTIFITHDLQEALKLATRMAVMLEGRIEQSGIPQEVFEQPANDRVAAFLGR